HIALTMTVTDAGPGSTFHLLAELSGGLLNGAVGGLVARVLEADVRRSVQIWRRCRYPPRRDEAHRFRGQRSSDRWSYRCAVP
ncbi:MAG: hypothetical protein QOK18_654, partial [Mycobacterium sp.]|nr:hypothetical protein [Mycobacterium sp.]